MNSRNLPALSTQATPIAAVLQPAIPQHYTNPGMSIAQVIAIMRAHWRQGVVMGLIVFAIMAILGITKAKTYLATATLQVNYEINDPLGGKEFPIGLMGSYIATQMELLSGPVVLTAVVDKLKLYDIKRFAGDLKKDEGIRRAAAEALLEKNVAVAQGRFGSQLIFIQYTGATPDDAATVANAIADVYTTRAYRNPALDQSAEERERYSAQLNDLKDKVETARNSLADFLKRTGLISSDAGDVEMAALSNLEGQLQDARSKRRQAEVDAAANRDTDTALGSAPVQALRAQLRTQLATMAEYRATDGPKNPRVIELQAQIDATRKSLADETRLDTGDSGSRLQLARQLENKLQVAADEQRERVIKEHQLKEEAQRYRLELELAQTAYRHALDSFEQISRDSSSKYSGINFISRATLPTKATGSRTRVSLMIGVVAGAFVGLGFAFLWGMVDRRIRCRDDIERDYGIPVIVEFKSVPA